MTGRLALSDSTHRRSGFSLCIVRIGQPLINVRTSIDSYAVRRGLKCQISDSDCNVFWGCSSSDGSGDSGGAGGSEADRGIAVDMGGAGGSGGAGAMGGSGGMGGAGGSGGSGGGMEEPIDSRCPDAQAGTYLLVAFPDRVDAYRQRMFGATYLCKFLDLAGSITGRLVLYDGDKVLSLNQGGYWYRL